MNIRIKKGDITLERVDAIVNAANSSLIPGGGVDGAITEAAGTEALAERRKLGRCPVGQARIATAGDLNARHIIYTVGPRHSDGRPELLAEAYRNSIKLALDNDCGSVAFPAISAGIFGFPPDEAADIALNTAMEFRDLDIRIVFILFTDEMYATFRDKFADLEGRKISNSTSER